MSFVETFRASPPSRQIVGLAVVAAIIFGLLAAGYFFFLRTPYDVLFTKLRPMDAATIVAELDRKKLPYHLADGGSTILVPRNIVDSTRLAVMSQDLPLKGTVGFELFNKSDMGLTEFAQRINYQRALQGELARTIMTMDTVDTARVHLSLAEPSIFREDRRAPKASITLVPRQGANLSPETVRGIQRLVAAAVPELAASDVVVLNEQGRIVSADEASVAVPDAGGGDERAAVEEYYAARVRRALLSLYPNADVRVTVSAQVAPGAAGDTMVEGWSPTSRTFGMSVAVSPPTEPTPEERADIRRLTDVAIGSDLALGDQVTIGLGPAVSQPVVAGPIDAPPQAAPASASVMPAPTKTSEPSQFWLNVLLPILGLLLIGAVLLHWRGRAPRALTSAQREDYVRRLRVLLDREDAHVSPSV